MKKVIKKKLTLKKEDVSNLSSNEMNDIKGAGVTGVTKTMFNNGHCGILCEPQ
ncbi:MAG: class I lanthipeptide [Bacteroidales bacterium]|nr:class I lanthipeptide [Bacteroidales bacterium]